MGEPGESNGNGPEFAQTDRRARWWMYGALAVGAGLAFIGKILSDEYLFGPDTNDNMFWVGVVMMISGPFFYAVRSLLAARRRK